MTLHQRSRLAALLLACSASAATAQVDSARAATYFEEAAALCEREGGRTWGISLCGPMVIADAATRTIATNVPVPDAPRPAMLGFVNAAIEWGDTRWSMFVWQLMPDNELERGRLMMHELFHRIQPRLGFPLRDGDNRHLDTIEGRYWLQLEWRALARALGDSGAARTAALRDALAFRAKRYSLFPEAAANEQLLEINEGLAQYTGTVAAAPSPTVARQDAARQLDLAPQYETFVRTFAYPSGAAYGVLLDVWSPGWPRRLKGTDDFGSLIRASARIEPSPDPVAAAAQYDGPVLRAAEEERERQRVARVAAYLRRFVEGPVLVMPGTRRSSSTTSGLTPLGDAGTIVRGFRTTGDWGSLEADAVLIARDRGTLTVPAPRQTEGRILTGDGWRLELAPNWGVRPGARDGDLRVAPDSTTR